MKSFLLLTCALFSFSLFATDSKVIHVEGSSSQKGWMQFSSSEEVNLKRLLELLDRSPTGSKLLKQAQYKASRSGQLLSDVIKVGEGSLTDTTLIRKFNPQSPENVIYESRSVVYLNRHLNWDDALLDLAHELTHFVYRESFNPYSDSFNARDFIRGTIEGQGGEVQAFLTECKVLKELFAKSNHNRSHCQKVEDSEGQLSEVRAIQLFYHVGGYFDSFKEQLNKRELAGSFSDLKDEKINFISSAYGVPYPVAALMEFDLVMNKVCENDKKRLAYMQQGPQRGPASVPTTNSKFQATHEARCRSK